jgi:hypothetical protein
MAKLGPKMNARVPKKIKESVEARTVLGAYNKTIAGRMEAPSPTQR